MKKLITLLLILPLFVVCSSDDDNTPTQDDTSFIVTIDASPIFPNCIAAYKRDNKYYKLAALGELTKGKYSTEVSLATLSFPVTEIYIFSDYNGVNRFDKVFEIKSGVKNMIKIPNGTGGVKVTDKSDPTQYPQ